MKIIILICSIIATVFLAPFTVAYGIEGLLKHQGIQANISPLWAFCVLLLINMILISYRPPEENLSRDEAVAKAVSTFCSIAGTHIILYLLFNYAL